MSNTEYPDYYLRGITGKDVLDEEGIPTSSLFQFQLPSRPDGFIEESINWYDDEGAVDTLLLQKKNNEIQFKIGAVVLERKRIDDIIKSQGIKNRLAYERNHLPENQYHGNLLLSGELSRRKKNQIAGSISLFYMDVLPNKYV
jgi:hypothetical protein